MATGFTYRHYILKDHLGSWTTITDAEGNVEQELLAMMHPIIQRQKPLREYGTK